MKPFGNSRVIRIKDVGQYTLVGRVEAIPAIIHKLWHSEKNHLIYFLIIYLFRLNLIYGDMDLQRKPLSRLSTVIFAIVFVDLTRSTFAGNYNNSILRIKCSKSFKYMKFFIGWKNLSLWGIFSFSTCCTCTLILWFDTCTLLCIFPILV